MSGTPRDSVHSWLLTNESEIRKKNDMGLLIWRENMGKDALKGRRLPRHLKIKILDVCKLVLFILAWVWWRVTITSCGFSKFEYRYRFCVTKSGQYMTMSYKFSEFAHVCACMDKSEKSLWGWGDTISCWGKLFWSSWSHAGLDDIFDVCFEMIAAVRHTEINFDGMMRLS